MADLIDYVPALLREIQPPGSDLFPGVTAQQWVGYLEDAFWEARIDGFGVGFVAEDGEVTGANGGEPSRELLALTVLYAGVKVIRNKILNTNTSFKAKAGPVEFEQQNSATMLAEMLKQLRWAKERLIDQMQFAATDTLVLDLFSTRIYDQVTYFGGPELAG